MKQKRPDAFTEKEKIQSYEIDDETIEHNPMGGIMFEVIINGDKKITGSMGLWKRSEDGPIESVGMDTSVGLQNLWKSKTIFSRKSIINGNNRVVYLAFFQIIKVRVIKLETKYCANDTTRN